MLLLLLRTGLRLRLWQKRKEIRKIKRISSAPPCQWQSGADSILNNRICMELIWILASNFLISSVVFLAALILLVKKAFLKKLLLFLVAFSAGTLMAAAFLHLIPEAVGGPLGNSAFLFVLFGFVAFFAIEKIFFWQHCHEIDCSVHKFAYLNLFGDAVHNFIDGLIIAASFIADWRLGVSTSLAILMHEAPQEIGDFSVLLYAGFSNKKALLFNFLTALSSVLGGLLGYFLIGQIEFLTGFLVAFAAGGFIYIAASDLIPEIRKETNRKKCLVNFVFFVLGVLLIYFFSFLELRFF